MVRGYYRPIMRTSVHGVLALTIAAALAACGSEEPPPDPPAVPDAATTQLGCAPRGGPAEAISLEVGLSADGAFTPFADGDTCPLVIGYQGFLMMVLELRAPMPLSFEGVCLECETVVSPAASFDGVTQQAFTQFNEQSAATFSGFSSIVLGEKIALEDLDGAEVDLTIECGGNGVTGEVAHTLTLDIPN